MAQIVQQTFTIVVSRLVKDQHVDETACTSDQTQMLLETLPGVVEQILDSDSAVVEVISD
jgi:hypothetical protein